VPVLFFGEVSRNIMGDGSNVFLVVGRQHLNNKNRINFSVYC